MLATLGGILALIVGLALLLLPVIVGELSRPRDSGWGAVVLLLGLVLVTSAERLTGAPMLAVLCGGLLIGRLGTEVAQARWRQLSSEEQAALRSSERWRTSLDQLVTVVAQLIASLLHTFATLNQVLRQSLGQRRPSQGSGKRWIRQDPGSGAGGDQAETAGLEATDAPLAAGPDAAITAEPITGSPEATGDQAEPAVTSPGALEQMESATAAGGDPDGADLEAAPLETPRQSASADAGAEATAASVAAPGLERQADADPGASDGEASLPTHRSDDAEGQPGQADGSSVLADAADADLSLETVAEGSEVEPEIAAGAAVEEADAARSQANRPAPGIASGTDLADTDGAVTAGTDGSLIGAINEAVAEESDAAHARLEAIAMENEGAGGSVAEAAPVMEPASAMATDAADGAGPERSLGEVGPDTSPDPGAAPGNAEAGPAGEVAAEPLQVVASFEEIDALLDRASRRRIEPDPIVDVEVEELGGAAAPPA